MLLAWISFDEKKKLCLEYFFPGHIVFKFLYFSFLYFSNAHFYVYLYILSTFIYFTCTRTLRMIISIFSITSYLLVHWFDVQNSMDIVSSELKINIYGSCNFNTEKARRLRGKCRCSMHIIYVIFHRRMWWFLFYPFENKTTDVIRKYFYAIST